MAFAPLTLRRGHGFLVRAGIAPLRSGTPRTPLAALPPLGSRHFYDDTTTSGPNALYLESLYGQWKMDKSKLDDKWDAYFEALEAGGTPTPPVPGTAARDAAFQTRMATPQAPAMPKDDVVLPPARPRVERVTVTGHQEEQSIDIMAVQHLIRAFQVRGHEEANLDPLGQHQWRHGHKVTELDPAFYHFTQEDMKRVVGGNMWRGSTGGSTGFMSSVANVSSQNLKLGDLLQTLRETYCGSIGVEYMHMGSRRRCNWIRTRVENPAFLMYDRDYLLRTYHRLCEADSFECFLGDKFKTTKRFGVDGGETVIPGLQACIERAVELGCQEVVVGMPHRGRLNVLTNVLKKPQPQVFAEFLGTAWDVSGMQERLKQSDWSMAGDVKYHLGISTVHKFPTGQDVTLTLEANPSHLETVCPVGLGRTRAKQFYLQQEHPDIDLKTAQTMIMPIVLHGDASFAGQGVVYESMQLAQVDDFAVGGTIHVIVNNQVGFTTDPKNARSTTYASDIGKAFNLPVFHVNGDDPVAVCRAFEIAAEWRQDWGSDVILDVICYRRFGHNENDNPDFTQPLLYKAIASHPRTKEIFAQRLMSEGHASREELTHIDRTVWEKASSDLEAAQTFKPLPASEWRPTKWKNMKTPYDTIQRRRTGVDVELLRKIGLRLCEVPEGFTVHNALKRILKQKRERIEAGEGMDWGTAEALAFGTLLLEGSHVRITGQDVQRGTFSHRHCVVIDQKTQEEYAFLDNLNLGRQGKFIARNSILSEYAVLGFELGYSYEHPEQLCIWEAQFGDFANTAQVVFDQFIAAGEQKWLQQSGLTVLLPHGYDGQGAEHSSCRLERFLQLCDDDEDDVPNYEEDRSGKQIQKANWSVLNVSTPAQYFHALRKQLHRDYRKPAVIAAPKNLLRLKACTSSFAEMQPETFLMRVLPERNPAIASKPQEVTRLVFCTGKIYYELAAEREKLGLTNVAIVTVELIAPFPFDRVKEQMELYSNVDYGDGVHPGEFVWCQEEPKNMGAWSYVRPRIATTAREGLNKDLVLRYIGRRAAAAPATGIAAMHAQEQSAIIEEALLGEGQGRVEPRPSAMLGHQT